MAMVSAPAREAMREGRAAPKLVNGFGWEQVFNMFTYNFVKLESKNTPYKGMQWLHCSLL